MAYLVFQFLEFLDSLVYLDSLAYLTSLVFLTSLAFLISLAFSAFSQYLDLHLAYLVSLAYSDSHSQCLTLHQHSQYLALDRIYISNVRYIAIGSTKSINIINRCSFSRSRRMNHFSISNINSNMISL